MHKAIFHLKNGKKNQCMVKVINTSRTNRTFVADPEKVQLDKILREKNCLSSEVLFNPFHATGLFL